MLSSANGFAAGLRMLSRFWSRFVSIARDAPNYPLDLLSITLRALLCECSTTPGS